VKPFAPKRFPWAGLLASGFVIVGGFVSILFVVLAFSDSQRRDVAIVVAVFLVIGLIPILSLRTPRDPAEKRDRPWWMFWRRKKRKKDSMQRYWRRRRGQDKNRPFGHPEPTRPATPAATRPSTFVSSPRKPTEP
jgi:hypothetical protein